MLTLISSVQFGEIRVKQVLNAAVLVFELFLTGEDSELTLTEKSCLLGVGVEDFGSPRPR